jgi:hypothetical protein
MHFAVIYQTSGDAYAKYDDQHAGYVLKPITDARRSAEESGPLIIEVRPNLKQAKRLK